MRVGRRLEVKPCEHDKRQLRYKPTPHALAETRADRLHGAALPGAGATDAYRGALAAPDFLPTFSPPTGS
ncbi:hypothetical protein M8494_14255 [Serratia ureilytica]